MTFSQSSSYQISALTAEEMTIPLDWAAQEGWNPGLGDGECFFAADPQGFLAGKIDGQPVATISAVRYGADFGFIGLYLVDKRFRGQGYGLEIWRRALEYLEGRTIGLDGVVAQQGNYQKSGFQLAYRHIRFGGAVQTVRPPDPHFFDLSGFELARLADYDRQFFPARREAFLRAWINHPHHRALGVVEQGQLRGYGVMRACRRGYKIGPLNAESKDVALELFQALLAQTPLGSEIYLDVPEPNAQAVELARSQGMEPCFETARMYAGAVPDLPLRKIFGVSSLELG
ncbi:MAG: GNAT family N-acetyltransferase [Cyanobacteria bacterium RI_101]|nr:GNAT family N-acetyltransferase [Cyanobacteria bacterium RI_101]